MCVGYYPSLFNLGSSLLGDFIENLVNGVPGNTSVLHISVDYHVPSNTILVLRREQPYTYKATPRFARNPCLSQNLKFAKVARGKLRSIIRVHRNRLEGLYLVLRPGNIGSFPFLRCQPSFDGNGNLIESGEVGIFKGNGGYLGCLIEVCRATKRQIIEPLHLRYGH